MPCFVERVNPVMTNNAEIQPEGFNLYALRHFSIDREWEIWPFLGRFFQPNGNSGGNGKLRKQLLVVARENPHIYEYLKRMFAGNETLEVVLDRRAGDRRGQGMAKLPDRRRSNDRRHQEIDSQLRALGWAIVLLDVAREQDRERGGRPRHVR